MIYCRVIQLTKERRLVVTIKNPSSKKSHRLFHVYRKGEMLNIDEVKRILRDALADEGYDLGIEED